MTQENQTYVILSFIYYNQTKKAFDATTFRILEKDVAQKCRTFKPRNVVKTIKEDDDPQMPNLNLLQKAIAAKVLADEQQARHSEKPSIKHLPPIFNRNKGSVMAPQPLRTTA